METATDPRAEYGHQYKTASARTLDAIYRSVAEDYVAEFNRLVREWRRDTLALSFVAQKTSHASFRRIVSMGELAIPLIVTELTQRPDFLFMALQEITGGDQAAAVTPRSPQAMVDAWLRWAERNGHAD